MEFPLIPTAIRTTVPLLILRFPLLGILLSSLIDMYDWFFVDTSTPEKLDNYQHWDKSMDIYYQVIIVFAVLKFKDTLVKRTAISLFMFRCIGLVLFYTIGGRQFLFFFPNFFENFVIAYLLFVFITKEKIMLTSKKLLLLSFLIIALPKTIHEFFQHFLLRQPWEIYDVGAFLKLSGIYKDYTNYITFGVLLHLLPILTVVYMMRKLRRNKSR